MRYGAVVSRGPVSLQGQDQARQLRDRVGRPGPPATIEQPAGRAGRPEAQPRCRWRRHVDRRSTFRGTPHHGPPCLYLLRSLESYGHCDLPGLPSSVIRGSLPAAPASEAAYLGDAGVPSTSVTTTPATMAISNPTASGKRTVHAEEGHAHTAGVLQDEHDEGDQHDRGDPHARHATLVRVARTSRGARAAAAVPAWAAPVRAPVRKPRAPRSRRARGGS